MNEQLFDELVESVVSTLANDGYNFEEGASQFRGSEEYNDWYSKFSASLDESEEINESALDEAEQEDVEDFENFIEDIMEACENCKSVDPETGEETVDSEEAIDEFQVHHMNASERNEQKKYRKSAAGRKAQKTYKKNLAKRHGRVNKQRSKLMSKVMGKARFINESEDLIIVFPFDDEELLQSVCDEFDIDFELEDGEATLCATEEELANALDKLDVEGEVSDYVVDDDEEDSDEEFDDEEDSDEEFDDEEDLDESDNFKARRAKARKYYKKNKSRIKKIRAKREKRLASKLNSDGTLKNATSAQKAETRQSLKTRKRHGGIMEGSIVSSILESAKFRAEAISESIESQFENTSFFGSLNESESNEIKTMVSGAVTKILDESYEKIAMDVIDECENYISEEVMPEIIQLFSEDYTQEIVKSLNENVDEYIEYAAQEIVDSLEDKNLIVKSTKTSQLEEFSEAVLDLIQDKLQIIPEQEDALLSAQEKIAELSEQVEEFSVERKKLQKRITESKKEAYVFKHMPEDISEAQKEHLLNYVDDVLCEAESMSEFMSAFDKAVSDINEMNENVISESYSRPAAPEKPQQQSSAFSSLIDAVSRLG